MDTQTQAKSPPARAQAGRPQVRASFTGKGRQGARSGFDIEYKIDKLESGIEWIKWSLGVLVVLLVGVLALINYLHSDTKQDIQRLRDSTSQDIKEIRTLLIELIQRQTLTNTSQQDTSKTSPARRQAKR